MDTIHKRTYQERLAIAQRVAAGTKSGQTIGQAAVNQGINPSIICKWIRRYPEINRILAGVLFRRKTRGEFIKLELRECLSCGCTFPSEGIHNRICGECKENQPRIAANLEAYV